MLRNLSVGKKIMVGFLIILIIMVVVMTINTVTSLTRNSDLHMVQNLAGMQITATELSKTFNEARTNANIVFKQLDSDAEYENCMTNITAVEDYAAKLETYSQTMGEDNKDYENYQAEGILNLQQSLADWKQAVTNVHDNNLLMEDARDNLSITSQNLLAYTTALAENVSRLTVQLSTSQELSATVRRIEKVIYPVAQLSAAVDAVRLDCEKLTLNFDTSVVEGIHTAIDRITAQAEEIFAALTTDEARTAISNTQAGLENFGTAVNSFVAAMNECDIQIQQADKRMSEVFDNIETGASNINTDMQNFLGNTISTSNFTTLLMLVLALIMIALSIVIAIVLARNITRPLTKIKNVLVQVGETGNLDFPDQVKAEIDQAALGKDEVGESIQSFVYLIRRLEYLNEALGHLAEGDLRIDIDLLSEDDSMGNAMKKTVEQLNQMFADIRGTSAQVATGAREISQGAQALAQGATEQSATIEKISASMQEIKNQATISEQTAQQAIRGSLDIKTSAQTGNESMGRMMSAMQQINEASRSIEQVIKTVDDIAFQTNILALNAAVEAARAGEHGKGFAVVAEEVRNLASKSADAAAQTATLIAANIEKAEMGLAISQETATSLAAIVKAVVATSESLQAMATQSQATSSATAQINDAMDQVAQVVAQNSATSQESAASSEQMSSQAQSLQSLISRFKLKETVDIPAINQPFVWPEEAEGASYPLNEENSKY